METRSGNVLENTRSADWERELVTHYTGIGTEVRESFHNGTPSETKVVVNMPQGLGRYGVEDAEKPASNATFEWYLKNHLGSTMLVYGTQSTSNADVADLGEVKKAYDYRSFGEQIDLIADAGDKVTENFTGKERDDETELNYFGARYLDPMLGLWISVDPKRQFASPYLYAGNGVNPIGAVDPDGSAVIIEKKGNNVKATIPVVFSGDAATADNKAKVNALAEYRFNGSFGKYNVQTSVVEYNPKIHGNTWNNINLLNEGSPKCGSSGSCVENRALPGQAYINVNNVHSIIHEFGHLLGLDDKYDSQYMGSGATYKIDSVKHWDHGYIYRVWNSLDSIMLQINLNERSLKRFSSTGYLTKEFVIDTIIVDEEIWNNRNLKRNTIVLEAPRRPENRLPANVSIFSPEIYFPFVVKFVCYRDFDDFFSCEDMVSAARVNHNCLDVKKYKFAK